MSTSPTLSPLPEPQRRDSLWRQRWRRYTDALSVYLPVFLMAFLALASYWLLRLTPDGQEAEPVRAERKEPDYFMQGFAVKVFEPDGRLRGEIAGTVMRHRPDNSTYEVDNARIRSLDERGALTTVTAQRMVSNDAQTEFVFEGEAVLVREAFGEEPRLEVRGERLQMTTEPRRVWSDLPVRIERDQSVVSANQLNYTGDPDVIEMQGQVRLLIPPR